MITINALCVILSGGVAIAQFHKGNTKLGWFNVVAAVANLAVVVYWLLGL